MTILFQAKFLFLAILFSSISSLVKSETPSHCSELYGCQVDDPQEEIIKQRLINQGITEPDQCMYKLSERCPYPLRHCTVLYGCQTEEFFSKLHTPSEKKVRQTNSYSIERKIDLNILQLACQSIGFTPNTEPFGNCVLKLSERKDLILTNKYKINQYYTYK